MLIFPPAAWVGRRRTPPAASPKITLNDAFVRYWDEHAERLASADNIYRIGNTLIAALGKTTLLSQLARSDIATYVATRRGKLADGSVNRELTILRAVMIMARDTWGRATAEIDCGKCSFSPSRRAATAF